MEPKQNNQQTHDRHSFPNHEREQLETATKRVETETERYTHTPQTGAKRNENMPKKGDVNREQYRSPDKSHGTMGRQ